MTLNENRCSSCHTKSNVTLQSLWIARCRRGMLPICCRHDLCNNRGPNYPCKLSRFGNCVATRSPLSVSDPINLTLQDTLTLSRRSLPSHLLLTSRRKLICNVELCICRGYFCHFRSYRGIRCRRDRGPKVRRDWLSQGQTW